jgi:hypothetical protein
MALIDLPANTAVEVASGTTNGLVLTNVGSTIAQIGPTDPSVDGPAFVLEASESIIMEPGSSWAASAWFALAVSGGQLSVTEVA